jgi:hypothetical protein
LVRFLLEATLKTRRFNSCYINELKLESLWKIIENYFLDMLLIHNKKIVLLKVYALAQKGLEGRRRRTGAKRSAIVLARSAPGWSECGTLQSLVRSVAEHLPRFLLRCVWF